MIAAGAARPKGELAPLITSNEDCYVVSKNAVSDPVIRPDAWRLTIDGGVARALRCTHSAARMAVWDVIETVSDPHRRHSALAHLSPINFVRRYQLCRSALRGIDATTPIPAGPILVLTNLKS